MNPYTNIEVRPDEDPHLKAYRQLIDERREALNRRLARLENSEYYQSEEHTAPVVRWQELCPHLNPTEDPYLGSGKSREVIKGLKELAAEKRLEWIPAHEEAQWNVTARTKLGEPVPAETLFLAEQLDYHEGLEKFSRDLTEGRRRLRPLR